MENPSSPLDTLRQLKEMLDAGALTPAEFDALKQRLVIAPGTAVSQAAAAPDAPAVPVTPVTPVLPATEAPGFVAQPAQPSAFERPSFFGSPPVPPEADAWVFEPEPGARLTAAAAADFPQAAGSSRYDETEALADENPADFAPAPAERNSSLGLLLAIGAVLVFLAVVAYLGFTRPASEHISSTSQTAADSVNTHIEIGPQVAPLPAAAAAPETIRVAPTNPAPVIQPRPAAPVADSTAPATNLPAADSAANQ